jgi:hypothetical protein
VRHQAFRSLAVAALTVAATAAGSTAVPAATARASGSTATHSAASPAVSAPGAYVPLDPTRILDTRLGLGAPNDVVPAGGEVTLQVTGQGGVPGVGAGAVILNVTVTDTLGSGYLTVYPAGGTLPTVSNVNFVKGQTAANLVTTVLGASGAVVIRNGSAGSVDLLADVSGYYLAGTPTDPGTFQALAPARVLDTRAGLGAAKAPVKAAGALTMNVAGHGGVPSTGARAVVFSLTATRTHATGYLSAYPAGSARPTASNVNFTAGATVPNLVTVALGGGKVTLYNGSNQPTDLIADIAGYYLAGTATKAGAFIPVTPARYLDSRSHLGQIYGPVGAHWDAPVQVLYRGGTGSTHVGGVPATNVSAVITNITATAQTRSGFVTVYPASPTRPTVSNLNFSAGVTRANLAVVPVGLCGQLSIYHGSTGNSHLIADVAGYFLAADATTLPTPTKTVKAWGGNEFGALADGGYTTRSTPGGSVGLSDIVSLQDQMALRSDGTVWGWGVNEAGGLGYDVGTTADFGFLSCALPLQPPGLPAGITAIASSGGSRFALTADHHVWAWGANDGGQLGDGTMTQRSAPAVVPGIDTVTAIASSGDFVLALKADGTVWGWGEERHGELGGAESSQTAPIQIAGLAGVTAIAAGNSTGYALVGGKVLAWGDASWGSLGNGTGAGNDDTAHPTPTTVTNEAGTADLVGVTAIAAGPSSAGAVALLSDGTARSWGINERGSLGDGQSESAQFQTNKPVVVQNLTNAVTLAVNGRTGLAIRSDHSLCSWGSTPGDAATTDRLSAAAVSGVTGVTAIGAGSGNGFAVVP